MIVGISDVFFPSKEIETISFDESTEIAKIPTTLIFNSKKEFYLPSSTKRVKCLGIERVNSPVVIIDRNNRFVSVTEKRNITNHHPLEIVDIKFRRTHLFIKETTRIIGIQAFRRNMLIESVVFPPSVEVIDDLSFFYCKKLSKITFKGKSNLRKIGYRAFGMVSIEQIDFPSSLEEIEESAFNCCKTLRSITFKKDSKLKKIGKSAFQEVAIQSIELPVLLEEIEDYAFAFSNIKSVSYQGNQKPKKISPYSFCY